MNYKKCVLLCSMALTISILTVGCNRTESLSGVQQEEKNGQIQAKNVESGSSSNAQEVKDSNSLEDTITVTPDSKVRQLTEGLSAVSYIGDYGFDEFLGRGGASSDEEVAQFLSGVLFPEASGLEFSGQPFGCSTIAVKSPDEDFLFGRNFDWNHCDAWIVISEPETGYDSISTVNMDFIGGNILGSLPEEVQVIAALYAPLDGMNEKGLCISVNMIQDAAVIDQNTEKPDITTTTAIRLLLNQAADVEEALDLLEQYDLHGSKGMMVHFALSDTKGRSVAVEYVDQQMVVTDTPVVTNFYLAQGEKNGIGTAQSHARYEILSDLLSEKQNMSMEDVKDALDSVSKDNFGEFESTEWSIIFNQSSGEVRYYHREDYQKFYSFTVKN